MKEQCKLFFLNKEALHGEKESEENNVFLSDGVEHGQELERSEQVTVVPSNAYWKIEHHTGPQQ